MVTIPPRKNGDDWEMVKMALFYPHHEVSKNDIPLRDQLPAALIENQLFKIFKQLTPHVLCSLRAMYCLKTNKMNERAMT
jgi:hypothetical protein